MQRLTNREMQQITGGNCWHKIGRETKRVVKQVKYGVKRAEEQVKQGADDIKDGYREFGS